MSGIKHSVLPFPNFWNERSNSDRPKRIRQELAKLNMLSHWPYHIIKPSVHLQRASFSCLFWNVLCNTQLKSIHLSVHFAQEKLRFCPTFLNLLLLGADKKIKYIGRLFQITKWVPSKCQLLLTVQKPWQAVLKHSSSETRAILSSVHAAPPAIDSGPIALWHLQATSSMLALACMLYLWYL